MVFRHLPRVPLYSVVVNIINFFTATSGIRTPIAAAKIKHANHYTIDPGVHQGGGGGVNTKIVYTGPGGGVKFFKFIANFQIGMGYQILGGCLNF